MVLETAFADALYLNWAIPPAALPPAPAGLRYDLGRAGSAGSQASAGSNPSDHSDPSAASAGSADSSGSSGSNTRESAAFFSLVLFRQVGLHLRGASWLALSYPQVEARLCVCDAANTPSVLVLRQLAPGWVVPLGRLVGGQPLSAAVCDFPDGLPSGLPGFEEGFEAGGERHPHRDRRPAGTPVAAGEAASQERVWRWKFAAGARLTAAVRLGSSGAGSARFAGAPAGANGGGAGGPGPCGGRTFEQEVAFFRDRTRSYWRQGEALRRIESERPAAAALPVSAKLEQTDWLETFLPFAPGRGWSEVDSAFLVPKVELAFAFGGARELPVAAPMAAAG